MGENPHAPAAQFAKAVNLKLATSSRKHVFIYLHGYKVTFENPVLVATELWHYLGYDGVFIAYAWPATPSRWAYLKDAETAGGYARNLRISWNFLPTKPMPNRFMSSATAPERVSYHGIRATCTDSYR